MWRPCGGADERTRHAGSEYKHMRSHKLASLVLAVAASPALAQNPNLPGNVEAGQPYPPGFTKEQMRRADASIIRPPGITKVRRRVDVNRLGELAEVRRVDDRSRLLYAILLKAEHTGIFKLFPTDECEEKVVVRADDNCWSSEPESSSYNFESGDYPRSRGDCFRRRTF